jgi:hypothetical protein
MAKYGAEDHEKAGFGREGGVVVLGVCGSVAGNKA